MINRSLVPEVASQLKFHLPEINHLTLDNGLKIIHVQKKNLPIIQLSFLINAGSKFDTLPKAGLSHLTAMMIDEGAGQYNSLQLDNEIEKLGSVLDISNNHDMLYVSLLTLKEHFERSLELTSLVLKDPKLHEEDFKREHHKFFNKLQQLYDDPGYIAAVVFGKICFEGTPYANPTAGIKSSINNLNSDDVREFYRNYFSGNNAALVVTGDINVNEIKKYFNEYLGDWSKATVNLHSEFHLVKKQSRIYIIDKPGSSQSELIIGHISDERKSGDYFAKLIMNSILGGQFSSRINLNLRENKGYTYGANSSFGYYANAGFFNIDTAVNTENTADALREIFKEINGMKTNIKDEEINFAKSYLIKSFPSKFKTCGQIATNMNSLVIHKLDDNYFNEYIDNISRVTKEEIIYAAKQKLLLEEMSIVIVGDVKIIRPKLEKFNLEIVELDLEGNRI